MNVSKSKSFDNDIKVYGASSQISWYRTLLRLLRFLLDFAPEDSVGRLVYILHKEQDVSKCSLYLRIPKSGSRLVKNSDWIQINNFMLFSELLSQVGQGEYLDICYEGAQQFMMTSPHKNIPNRVDSLATGKSDY